MKSRVLVSLLLMTVTCAVIAKQDFKDIPYLPESVNVGRESYNRKVIRSPYSPFFQTVLDSLYGGRSRDVFDLQGEMVVWSAGSDAGNVLALAKLQCPVGLECITLRTQGGIFLITFTKGYKKLVDYSLIYARESYYDKDRRQSIRKKTLYSYFGENEDPVSHEKWKNDLSETGIFCSSISDQVNPAASIQYKRRITAIGVIEYKKLNDWRECRAPW